MLEHKKSTTFRDGVMLKLLMKNNPSYKGDERVVDELKKRNYIIDINQQDAIYNPETGYWRENRLAAEVRLELTEIGEKALYTSELKSESIENFFDKTVVRITLVIGSVYGFGVALYKIIGYLKDVFIN